MTITPLLGDAVVDHVEVFVPDRAAAASWYGRVLGYHPRAEHDYWATPRGPRMLLSAAGGAMIALFERPTCPERGRTEHHRVAFRVDGETFLRFVAAAPGGPIYDEMGTVLATVTPVDHGGAFSVYFCDPFGNRCEVTTYDWRLVLAKGDPAWAGDSLAML